MVVSEPSFTRVGTHVAVVEPHAVVEGHDGVGGRVPRHVQALAAGRHGRPLALDQRPLVGVGEQRRGGDLWGKWKEGGQLLPLVREKELFGYLLGDQDTAFKAANYTICHCLEETF